MSPDKTVGDVIDRIALTPVAIAEGMVLAANLFRGESNTMDYADVPTAVRAMESGAVTFLEKPCDEETLCSSIRRALDADADARGQHTRTRELRTRLESLTTGEWWKRPGNNGKPAPRGRKSAPPSENAQKNKKWI